jgi:DoxX-like family
MFIAYVIVTILAAGANIYAATNDFIRPKWLLENMSKLGVPESSLPVLGMLKAAGGLGLLIGIAVPLIGTTAALGLTLFFIGAVIAHLRAHDVSLGKGVPVIFLLIVLAALVPGIYGRESVDIDRR